MMSRTTIRPLLSRVALLASVITWFGSVAPASDSFNARQQQPGPAAVALQAVAAGEDWTPPEDAVAVRALVAELAEFVAGPDQGPDQGNAELAIRALAAIGPRAAPAVDVLCTQLDKSPHSTRAFAAEALIAIGEPAVEPLRELLPSPAARARAAATFALGRLKQLSLDEVQSLAADDDPRVRAATADALAHLEADGVPLLVALLQDEQPAVAVAAAAGLATNRTDPPLAVPALSRLLQDPVCATSAAEVLAKYGTDARSAVPDIIRATGAGLLHHPTGLGYSVTQSVLQYIGPPGENAIPELCELLTSEDEEVQILAATTLGLMGEDARSAAEPIEEAIKTTLARYLERMRQYDPEDPYDSPGRVHYAAELMVSALWHVTHDAERFVTCIESTINTAGEPITYFTGRGSFVMFAPEDPWTQFTKEDLEQLDRLLRHQDANVRHTAIIGLATLGKRAQNLVKRNPEIVSTAPTGQLPRLMQLLAEIGPEVAADVAPLLLKRYRDGDLQLRDFATAVRGLEIRDEEFLDIFRDKLEEFQAASIHVLLPAVSQQEQQRIVQTMITPSTGLVRMSFREKFNMWARDTPAPEIAIPFLQKGLRFSDAWDVRAAVIALEAYGVAHADQLTDALPILRTRLEHSSLDVRLQTAHTIYRLTGETEPLTQLLDRILNGADPYYGGHAYHDTALRIIAELGAAGAPFQNFVLDEVNKERPFVRELTRPVLAACLRDLGTPEAIAALEELATSRDWAMRTQATNALAELRNKNEGDN